MITAVSIPWERYGIRPHDLIGWQFSTMPVKGNGKNDNTEGLLIHCPVTIRVQDGNMELVSPASPSGFVLQRDWDSVIRLEERWLTIHLPLALLSSRKLVVLNPSELEGDTAHETIRLRKPRIDEVNRSITLHFELQEADFELKAGTIIAAFAPYEGSKLMRPIRQTLQHAAGLFKKDTPEETLQHEDETEPEQYVLDLPDAPEGAVGCEPFTLRVWRIHPQGVRVAPAEKTLRGDAPTGAVKWCGPFVHANQYGFWLFPPLDVDIIWHGGYSFDYNIITPYEHSEMPLIQSLQGPLDKYQYAPRVKIEYGTTLESVVSIWTGCIFQTPPGWGLMIRNPVNINYSNVFRIQEGILETDWMAYDIWMNLQFIEQGKWVHIRRDAMWPPIAQLIPVRREGYDQRWNLIESNLSRNTELGDDLYKRWDEYNYKKWVEKNRKEPTTYNAMRAQYLRRSKSEREDNLD